MGVSPLYADPHNLSDVFFLKSKYLNLCWLVLTNELQWVTFSNIFWQISVIFWRIINNFRRYTDKFRHNTKFYNPAVDFGILQHFSTFYNNLHHFTTFFNIFQHFPTKFSNISQHFRHFTTKMLLSTVGGPNELFPILFKGQTPVVNWLFINNCNQYKYLYY